MSGDQSLLTGLRVLDISQFVPGPFATRTLSDLGADVIKVEPPGGEPFRFLVPGSKEKRLNPLYKTLNRGKRIVEWDLKRSVDKDKLFELVASADAVLESYRPGVVDRLGIDFGACQSINPKLVYCSLSGYGQTGPHRNRAGHDINYCAVSGQLHTDMLDRGQSFGFPPLADHTGAMLAANSLLAGLYSARSKNQGHYLDVSIYESMLSFQYMALEDEHDGQSVYAEFIGGGAACYNIYGTSDSEYVSLGAVEPHFWTRFCDVVGRPDWVSRQFEDFPQNALICEVQSEIQKCSLAFWIERFADVDCCFEPVQCLSETLNHDQTISRQLVNNQDISFPLWIDGVPLAMQPDKIEPQFCSDAIKWR
ncbi:MAG: CoA transferase [Pseudomonadota bacterium]